MNHFKYPAILSILLLSFPALADEGRELFDKYCISCHKIDGQPQLAPPIFGVINHVKSAYPEREQFVKRIVTWVNNPNPDNILMPGAVRRFGLMPKLGYPSEDVHKIAEFLYDFRVDLPNWYRKHYRQEHGKPPAR